MDIEEAQRTLQTALETGPFEARWDALTGYTVPSWYADGKFGIFIHWGVYAVPAFDNEWYSRNMYIQDSVAFKHHVETYGPQTTFGYKDFIPMFTAEKFDPDAWAALFRQAGARYVVPVAEHHDGFAMYDCSLSPWNAARMGPRRDVLGELATAIRGQGLTFGLSSHRAEHWWFMNGGRAFPSDVQDARYQDFYGPAQLDPENNPPNTAFLDDWMARLCELVEKYQPQLLYFDWWIEQPAFQPYLPRLAAYYYNRAAQWQRGVVINYKQNDFKDRHAFAEGSAVYDVERGQLAGINPRFWQADTSIMRNSWCHISAPVYKTASSLIIDLVDVVSKNGTLLLNVGPRADGTIPEQDSALLLAIGRWLTVNGEAIYGSRPWKIYGEGPTETAGGSFTDGQERHFTGQDMRFTTQGETLYAIILAWPADGRVLITSLAAGSELHPAPIEQVELLGSSRPVSWTRTPTGLLLHFPDEQPWEYPRVVKIR
ncbi:MAG TPA: alpha-L-fucosidase [Ktedonobacteraceae bacterium]|nr:alpha-L-fucosidase [Ktedonobacteraceae bacterium]